MANVPIVRRATRIHVVVMTYNRTDTVRRLLSDVLAWADDYEVSVAVYDDASDEDYSEIVAMCERQGFDYVRAGHNHGKRGFWRWVGRMYNDQRSVESDFWYVVADDYRLCEGFFKRAISLWSRIASRRKVCLTTVRCHRALKASFNEGHQVELGDGWINSGWNDCSQFSEEFFFKALGYRVAEVSDRQWRKNSKRGSGVGGAVTRHLAERNLEMYCVEDSLAVHVNTISVMNDPKLRRANPLGAERFVEGERMHAILAEHEPVTAHMATVPWRIRLLEQTVDSLYDHVDKLCIYLNGYKPGDKLPVCVGRERIETKIDPSNELGDAGKFHWAGQHGGYNLHCDDDIVYPPDYVHRMVRAIERYKREAVVGIHGILLPEEPTGSYYRNRAVLPCRHELKEDARVNMLGTGVIAYHSSTIDLSTEDFASANMADIWMGIAAKRQSVPMMCLAHDGGWIETLKDPKGGDIYTRYSQKDQEQSQLVRQHGPWEQFDDRFREASAPVH